MEIISCALCNSRKNEILETRTRFGLRANTVICTNCGLVFLNPRMTAKEYSNFYSSSAYRHLYTQLESPSKELDERSIRGAKEKFLFFLKTIDFSGFKNKNSLDIGCSAGYLPYIFSKNHWTADGLEPTKTFARYGRKKFGLNIMQGFIETININKKYGFITMIHVFEHITNPHLVVKKLRNMLSDDGLLYLEVPNVHEFYGRFDQSCEIAHPYFYSAATLTSLLEFNGFKICKLIHGSSLRVFAKKGQKKAGLVNEYNLTKAILKKKKIEYYTKGYFIFTPLFECMSRTIAKNSQLTKIFKKFARFYSQSRLPFSVALKQLGAIE